MSEHNHIICIYDTGFYVVGPFLCLDDLKAYGKAWQEANNDDPRWQSLYLDNRSPLPHTSLIPYRREETPTGAYWRLQCPCLPASQIVLGNLP